MVGAPSGRSHSSTTAVDTVDRRTDVETRTSLKAIVIVALSAAFVSLFGVAYVMDRNNAVDVETGPSATTVRTQEGAPSASIPPRERVPGWTGGDPAAPTGAPVPPPDGSVAPGT